MNEQEIKEQLCDICHKMWQLGWGKLTAYEM